MAPRRVGLADPRPEHRRADERPGRLVGPVRPGPPPGAGPAQGARRRPDGRGGQGPRPEGAPARLAPEGQGPGRADAGKERGSAVDAALPPITAADLGAAKQVEVPSGPVPWTALPPTAPAAKPPTGRPIRLRVGALDILSLLVSGPESPQAFVVSSPGAGSPPPRDGRAGRHERWTATTSRAASRSAGSRSPRSPPRSPCSPGATHILLAHSGGSDRLDIHTAKGEHVVGWRPYDKESGDDRDVVWADFLDPGRVLDRQPGRDLDPLDGPRPQGRLRRARGDEGPPDPRAGPQVAGRAPPRDLADPRPGDGRRAGRRHRHGPSRVLLRVEGRRVRPRGGELAAVLDGDDRAVGPEDRTGPRGDPLPCPRGRLARSTAPIVTS